MHKSVLFIGITIFYVGLFIFFSCPANAKIPEQNGIRLSEHYFQLGREHARDDEFNRAIMLFSRAIELNPQNFGAYSFRGAVYFEIKSYKKALEDFDKALDMKPECVLCYSSRAQTKEKLEDWIGAYEDYTSAIVFSPKDPELYYKRASLFVYINKNRDKALSDLAKCFDIDSKNKSRYYRMRASIFSLSQEKEKAILDYKELLRLGENDSNTFYNIGSCYFSLEYYDKAVEYFNKAINIDPDNDLALFEMAKTYSVLDEKEEALKYLKLAFEKGGIVTRIGFEGIDHRWKNIKEMHEFKKLVEKY